MENNDVNSVSQSRNEDEAHYGPGATEDEVSKIKTAAEIESVQGHTEAVPANGNAALITDSVQFDASGSSLPVGIADTRSMRQRRWTSLESVTVRKFKAAQDATVPLGTVTILVGPNGSGKSSVLQAVHWAARAASYVQPKNTKEMISFERLDYVPSSDPLSTLHCGELKSDSTSAAVEVDFSHQPIGGESISVTVRIRAARNRGGITAYMEGGASVTPYKQRVQFITTYIPGLAGLSEKETILAQPTLRRQAASGDAGGVLRNVLLNLRSRRIAEKDESYAVARLAKLNELVGKVHPGVTVNVLFDDREDYHISATIETAGLSGKTRPLETAATGVLQVIQIFAYLILFEPKLMLIDEPDAHLHPDKQERLIEALELAAPEFDAQILLTTHSPHIVRAASASTKLVWMANGKVQPTDDDAIRRLLGWGGLDKRALFFVEDEEDKPLRALLRQWPELSRNLAICRCMGIDNLPRDKLLQGLLIDGQLKLKALLHRDGDFMNGDEAARWKNLFSTPGVFPWITKGSDIEAYFCAAEYLVAVFGITPERAHQLREEAAKKVTKARDTFIEKRKFVVRAVWPNGGSPDAERLWLEAGGATPETVKGKKLLAALKPLVKAAGLDDGKLSQFKIPPGFELAPDLRSTIELALSNGKQSD